MEFTTYIVATPYSWVYFPRRYIHDSDVVAFFAYTILLSYMQ